MTQAALPDRLRPPSRRQALLVLATALAGQVVLPRGARAGSNPPPAGATLIGPDDLARALAERDPFLVNVHVPYEGEIEGTDALIPFDRIGEDPALLPADLDAEIVLYCRSGRMSAIAAERLAALGFTRISDLEGGMNAWEATGRPLVAR